MLQTTTYKETPNFFGVDYTKKGIATKVRINYTTFGSTMKGRTFSDGSRYRYGFNGKENDNETVGTGEGTQDYGLRIYNPSLGRFLSVDPLAKSFAWNSTYAYAENSPICFVDLDGAEKMHYENTNQGLGVKTRETPLPNQQYWGRVANPNGEENVLRYSKGKPGIGSCGKIFWSNSVYGTGLSYPGCMVYVKPYPIITNTPPTAPLFTPNNLPTPIAPVVNGVTFSFASDQSSGLTPAQTAALANAIPPQGAQPPVPTAPRTSTSNTVTGLNAEDLPVRTTTTTNTQPVIIANNNTIVTITIRTGATGPSDPTTTPGVNSGQLMANRANAIKTQLIGQGVPAANIIVAPVVYGGVGIPAAVLNSNGNQTTVTATTNTTNQTGNVSNQQTQTINMTYGK